jgi:uncharacterized protein (DUF3084 family)
LFGLFIIFSVAVIGGLIAFLGDRVGMRVGKKRLTFFGLRPKYTSIIITIITGILISGSTLLLLSMISKDVRLALFHLQQLQQELLEKKAKVVELTGDVLQKEQEFEELVKDYRENEKELTRVTIQREKIQKELEAAVAQYREAQQNLQAKEGELHAKQKEVQAKQKRVASLTDITKELEGQNAKLLSDKERYQKEIEGYIIEATKLRGSLEQSKTRLLVFDVNEVIVAQVVDGGSDPYRVRTDIIQPMLEEANRIALDRGAKIEGKSDYAIKVPVHQMLEVSKSISKLKGKAVLRLTAEENTFFLEPLCISFELFPNELVFKANEVLAEAEINPDDEESEIMGQILNQLMAVRKKAFQKGMISQGQYIGEITSLQEIPNIISQVKNSKEPRVIQLAVIKDTWRVEGPLKVRIQIKK